MCKAFVVKKLPPENSYGKTEYKLKLSNNADKKRIERLASQMKYRLAEGGGEAFYVIGVTDDGEPLGLKEDELKESILVLEKAASRIGAKIQVLRKVEGKRGLIAEVLVRLSREEKPPVQVTIAALGNVDAGKSTLIGVLCSGVLDNGNGLAMQKVARFLHEIKSGRTSSVSVHLLGFDDKGKIVNYSLINPLDEPEIFLRSSKVLQFSDLGGHEKYLKTTLRGVMSKVPDYVMLVIAANSGLQVMGREHLGISIALRIPVFVVINKIDMVYEEKVEEVVSDVKRILKMPGINKLPIEIKDKDDIIISARHISSGRIVPIFRVSSVTGEGLDELKYFLNIIPPRMMWAEKMKNPLLIYVDEIFNVKGVGAVAGGLILSGIVNVDENLLLGPFKDGSWKNVRVKSIHINRVPSDKAFAGLDITLALAGIKHDEIEKGMTLIDARSKPRSVRMFSARITILKHPTTITRGYQAVLHLNSIRSTVKFKDMDKEVLRTGDTSNVILEFLYHPWYVREGDIFVLRDARTRAIGTIIRIIQ